MYNNLVKNEFFLEATNEIKYYSKKFKEIGGHVTNLVGFDPHRIKIRIDEMLRLCNIVRHYLEICMDHEPVYSNYLFDLEVALDNLNAGYREITTAIGQYNFEPDIKKMTREERAKWNAERVSLLETIRISFTNERLDQIISCREEFLVLLFGKDYLVRHPNTGPILFCWPTNEYSFFPNTNLISIPPSHLETPYLWSAIVHEAIHLKVNKFIDLVDLSRDEISPHLDSELNEIWGTKWDAILREYKVLRDRIIVKLSEKLWYNHIVHTQQEMEKIRPPSVSDYHNQFLEIICDAATVKTIGAADLFSTSSSWVFHCCNKYYASIKYLNDNRHPPAYVRAKYISDILSDKLNYKKCKYFTRWMKHYDDIVRPEETGPPAWKDILNYYTIVEKELNNIYSLASKIIFETKSYNHNRFNELVKKSTKKAGEDLSVVDKINLAWIRIIDCYHDNDEDGYIASHYPFD